MIGDDADEVRMKVREWQRWWGGATQQGARGSQQAGGWADELVNGGSAKVRVSVSVICEKEEGPGQRCSSEGDSH